LRNNLGSAVLGQFKAHGLRVASGHAGLAPRVRPNAPLPPFFPARRHGHQANSVFLPLSHSGKRTGAQRETAIITGAPAHASVLPG
jgi:hypothetical protein